MAIRPVLKMGDPRLWQQARAVVAFDAPQLHALIADMQNAVSLVKDDPVHRPYA